MHGGVLALSEAEASALAERIALRKGIERKQLHTLVRETGISQVRIEHHLGWDTGRRRLTAPEPPPPPKPERRPERFRSSARYLGAIAALADGEDPAAIAHRYRFRTGVRFYADDLMEKVHPIRPCPGSPCADAIMGFGG